MRLHLLQAEPAETVTVHVPLTIRRRGGRKAVITPGGMAPARLTRRVPNNTMVKALARAFRWRRLIESGQYGSIDEIATAEKINPSYVARVLRLTLLSPEVVEAILNGCPGAGCSLEVLMKPFPVRWDEQSLSW